MFQRSAVTEETRGLQVNEYFWNNARCGRDLRSHWFRSHV